jgi:cytochrome c-type biogenesis protein
MEALIGSFDVYLQSAPLMALAAAFAAGILTSFTPCVYPLIPITIGVIGARSAKSRGRALYLSLMYVLGLALVYAALGAFAALSGTMFGQLSTSKWTFLVVGNIFLLFGLSMLDVFSLQFNAFQKWSPASGQSRGAFTAFVFGGVSAFVAGPCTTPVLGSLLAYVASRQNVLLGCSMLFVFALGLGFVLVIVGTFSGLLATLPRAGGWMNMIKKAFGFLMILVGEYFILKAGQLML